MKMGDAGYATSTVAMHPFEKHSFEKSRGAPSVAAASLCAASACRYAKAQRSAYCGPPTRVMSAMWDFAMLKAPP